MPRPLTGLYAYTLTVRTPILALAAIVVHRHRQFFFVALRHILTSHDRRLRSLPFRVCIYSSSLLWSAPWCAAYDGPTTAPDVAALFHALIIFCSHALQLRQAKLSFPSVYLLVGVNSDDQVWAHKARTVMVHAERCAYIHSIYSVSVRWPNSRIDVIPLNEFLSMAYKLRCMGNIFLIVKF